MPLEIQARIPLFVLCCLTITLVTGLSTTTKKRIKQAGAEAEVSTPLEIRDLRFEI